MKLENVYWPATLAWAAIIFYQSISPATVSQRIGITFTWFSFVEHFVAYALLCSLFYLSLNYSNQRKLQHNFLGQEKSRGLFFGMKQPVLHAFMFAVIYGAAMELVQGFFAYRVPSIADALTNTIGAFTSAAIFEVREKKWI